MRITIISAFSVFFTLTSFGQIDMSDSSAQVISYWEKGDKYEYSVISQKIKLVDADTNSNVISILDVEVKVLAATDTSYTVQWLYKNIRNNSTNPDASKILNANKGLKVIYKTDELGNIIEVVNWEEIQKRGQKLHQKLAKGMKETKELLLMLKQYEISFSSKEAIQTYSIKEIAQFHAFHGSKYILGGTLRENTKLPNMYGEVPFDASLSVTLTDIDVENEYFTLNFIQ